MLAFIFKFGGAGFVSKDKFKGIISFNVSIPDVRKIDFINYYDNKGIIRQYSTRLKFYRDWKSDEQISQVMKYGHRVDKFALMLLMVKLLQDLPDRIVINKLFDVKSDREFYEGFFKQNYRAVDPDLRAEIRAGIVWSNIKFLKIPEGSVLLEIGCGTGKITEELNKIMRFREIQCIELESHKSDVINFNKPREDKTLNFANGYFDVIMASLSLHHVDDIAFLVREMYRVLKPGGYLILREHLSWDVFDAMIIDIEHMAYIIGVENRPWTDAGTGYGLPVRFPNTCGWDSILQPFIWHSQSDEVLRKNKELHNPTNISWLTYTKGEPKKFGKAEYTSDMFRGAFSRSITILDVRLGDVQYVNFNGNIVTHKTFSDKYVEPGKQIKAILDDRKGTINLLQVGIKHSNAPIKKIIDVIYKTKNDDNFFKFFTKNKFPSSADDHLNIYKYTRLIINQPHTRILIYGVQKETVNKYKELIGFSEVHEVNNIDEIYNLNDEHFDYILLFNMASKIVELNEAIRCFYRILKHTGYFICREGMPKTSYQAMVVNVENTLNNIKFGTKEVPIRFPNALGWDVLFKPFVWDSHRDEDNLNAWVSYVK